MGKIEAKQPSPQQAPEDGREPVLLVAVGRQRVGKTTLLNALVEIYRKAGSDIEVWNADLHNRTHTLSLFHEDALSPRPGASVEDQRAWIEERVRGQVKHRRDVVLDVGGGLTALNTLVEQVRLVDILERRGIRPVLVYVLGGERADLDYLERFAEDSMFSPKATVLAFNAGLVTGGRSTDAAFEPLLEHPAVLAAIKGGARIVTMPALGCMSAVTDRGLGFEAFAEGSQSPTHPETSFFDQERAWLWFSREMPRFFERIPGEWLPRVPAAAVATSG